MAQGEEGLELLFLFLRVSCPLGGGGKVTVTPKAKMKHTAACVDRSAKSTHIKSK
jgi:hypothetical protein